MKIKMSLIIAVCLVGSLQAADFVSREVKGVGKTRQQAIKNALYEAVSQVHGVAVTSGIADSAAFVGNVDVQREEVNKSIEMEGISVRAQDTLTLTLAEGLIKSYKVLDESTREDGSVEVTLKADVYDYSSPIDTDKTSLAVFDFETTQPGYMFGNLVFKGREIAAQFTQKLTTMLQSSNRFTLLDRSGNRAFEAEKRLMQSDSTNLAEKSRLGEVIGADYLLTGRIRRATLDVDRRMSAATGYPYTEYEARFVAEVRLLVPATRQVAFSNEYRLRLETPEVKKLVDKWETEEVDYDELKDALFEKVGGMIIEDLFEKVSPVAVAAITDDRVLLNQGGQRLEAGNVYGVFSQGQAVIDPDTNESLGTADEQIATVTVVKTLPKFSYAVVTEGSIDEIVTGQVCRLIRPEVEDEAGIGKKSNIQRSPSGGVRMPFD